jgi:hypothetical protein
MAFFRTGNQEITKEDLIKAGLDPDKAVTKEQLDTLKAELQTSMTETIRTSLAELASTLRTPQRTDDQNNNNEDRNDRGDRGDNNRDNREPEVTPVDFMEDPVRHATEIANKSASTVLAHQIKFAADLAWDRGLETLPGMKNDALQAEIKAEWDKYPVAGKSNASILLRNLHDMVMGRHQNEIMQDTMKKEGKFNLVQAGGSSSTQNRT